MEQERRRAERAAFCVLAAESQSARVHVADHSRADMWRHDAGDDGGVLLRLGWVAGGGKKAWDRQRW